MTFNPLRERGLERFTDPQSPVQVVAGGTRTSSDYYHLKIGGDPAAIVGICNSVIAADDDAQREGDAWVLDVGFIDEHTSGFDEFSEFCRTPRLDQSGGEIGPEPGGHGKCGGNL